VLPEVKGRLAGYTLLVPSAIVSVADFTVRTAKATRYEDISAAMRRA
jgi:glyceraldehyde-3-phosphate dehydrogenase/erythrose-4-phosphate dehydrogenase